jgi:hypothetical protein
MSARVDTSTAASLLRTLLFPLYPREVLADLPAARKTDANPSRNPGIYAALDSTADVFVAMAPGALGAELALDRSDASVHRLGAALTREARGGLLQKPNAEGIPELALVMVHAAIYVGACVVRNHGGVWQVRNPLWESLVRLESRAGVGELALLSWLCRALADDEIDRAALGDRYRLHVEVPCASPDELPVIASPDRKLPRLKAPRYDTLHKYLRAHLPELRDLGADFPSPERFAEMAFAWLEFVLVGGGRMLVMHGPTDAGVHVFWLDLAGFAKVAYYPADAFPEHKVEARGETVRVIVPLLGKTVFHEVLWWGP